MDEIILDTIVFDYLTRNQKALSATARERIEQADTVYVSVISIWELANHVREGLIVLNADFDSAYQGALQTLGLTLLDIQWSALRYLATFDYQVISKPWQRTINEVVTTGVKQELHKDPFDRMIIAHGLAMNLPVVSPDTLFPYYADRGLRVVW
ncbi:type II toxin-antitoxin system VapC family toxin [Fibrella sp. HMF5335]|uniref:Type II toxin-antitoxin system VapC family toxin n=1 Tax=Fibrella rubiginis TaxID=2817060 RepID=A0A939K3Z5_9BACT|nr:type II toxin-antitoxin system VapC family toxin [Fibrella rubiginis]MBO0939772.1 type II toxin-antitoxin system VapC family toxin [Fibrella rubiginis]